jgi:N-acetylmuramoyl-L-alanine amidase
MLSADDALCREGAKCDLTKTKIVVDVGHTAQSRGATSARGLGEFQFNLDLAQVVVDRLKAGGLSNASLLTAEGVGRDQLLARQIKAAASKPDFLISIHHDSVQSYLLKTWRYRGELAKYNDDFSGFSIFIVQARTGSSEELEFSERLGGELIARGIPPTTYHSLNIPGERRETLNPRLGIYRNDGLAVLRNDNVKIAILLEAGFII